MHVLVLSSPSCDKDSKEYDFLKWNLLKSIIENSEIAKCNGLPWTKMTMKYGVDSWTVEFEALEDKKLP